MKRLNYAAVGIGPNDAKMGEDFYKRTAPSRLTIVDASPVAHKGVPAYTIRDVGGVRVGVVSFGDLAPGVVVDGMKLRKARYDALKQARAKSDVLILLDQAGVATSDWVEKEAPFIGAPDIVIGGSTTSTVMTDEKVIGRTHLMPILTNARTVGYIDLDIVPGQDPKMALHKALLTDKYAEDPGIARQVAEAADRLAAATVASSIKPAARGSSKAYYGPQQCKTCHAKEYEDWAKTKHAAALNTLVVSGKTTPDCLQCHSETFRVIGKYVAPESKVGGVDCQTCHYYSLPHGAERKNSESRAMVDHKICLSCHTPAQSPDYKEETFLPKVAHLPIRPFNNAKPRNAGIIK